MSLALLARSGVLGAYLIALACHGLGEPLAQVTAVAVVALWAVSLLHDRHRHNRWRTGREHDVA